MSASWVAGSIRGRLMLEHRIGPLAAREIAEQESWTAATGLLAGTLYADARPAATLEQAEREIAATLALQIRVLAAWLPREGAALLRVLAAWFELANIEDRLAYLAGGELWPPVPLGVLASAWDGVAQAQDAAEMRRILAATSWGEPGGERPAEIALALRFGWARRVALEVPEASAWAAGAAAVVLASELFLAGSEPAPTSVPRILGADWPGAGSLPDLCRRLPQVAAWPLAGIEAADELWRAQLRWWRQVGLDARAMLGSGWQGRGVIVGVVALLALDAARVGVALALAAGAAAPPAREVLDALC